jgi:hypothetical protein
MSGRGSGRRLYFNALEKNFDTIATDRVASPTAQAADPAGPETRQTIADLKGDHRHQRNRIGRNYELGHILASAGLTLGIELKVLPFRR